MTTIHPSEIDWSNGIVNDEVITREKLCEQYNSGVKFEQQQLQLRQYMESNPIMHMEQLLKQYNELSRRVCEIEHENQIFRQRLDEIRHAMIPNCKKLEN